jgi:hypothetical protein
MVERRSLEERENIYSCAAAESLACPRVNRSRCGDERGARTRTKPSTTTSRQTTTTSTTGDTGILFDPIGHYLEAVEGTGTCNIVFRVEVKHICWSSKLNPACPLHVSSACYPQASPSFERQLTMVSRTANTRSASRRRSSSLPPPARTSTFACRRCAFFTGSPSANTTPSRPQSIISPCWCPTSKTAPLLW